MQLTIGSYVIDGTPASSTTTVAALRLDFEFPFVPKTVGNELRVPGLKVYIEASSEANCAAAVLALETQFKQASGKTITFYNTAGTAIYTINTTDWPEIEIEAEIDQSDTNAEIAFDIVARRPTPVSGGTADEPGQRGEIEWALEIGPNGLTGATATAEFGPTAGASAKENMAAWITKLYASPPTGTPAFWSNRLRAVQALPIAFQKPNQAAITNASYDPCMVTVLFREVYSGLANIPALATDINVNTSMANSEAMDVRSGEVNGPAIITLAGWFTIITETPTGMLPSATKVDRGAIMAKAIAVFEAIEGDFKNVHSGLTPLVELGAPTISLGLDSGKVVFSRTYSTTYVTQWREKTHVSNVDPVVINRDYAGKDIVHHGKGGPVAVLTHSLFVESIGVPKGYTVPSLGSNWVRLSKDQDATVTSKLRGGTLIFTTEGQSAWRYVNPSERGPSDKETQANGKVLTIETIGNGSL
jgi:hypothetical protein